MGVPEGDAVLTKVWLNSALAASPTWRHGSLHHVRAAQIGALHGFGGRVHRVSGETASGTDVTLVVKQDTGRGVTRELLFRRATGDRADGCIPACFGGWADDEHDRGVLLFEDVSPARQGDVLEGCTLEQATATVLALARLHAATRRPADADFPPELPRWPVGPLSTADWAERLARAAARFPEALPAPVVAELRDLPGELARSLGQLRAGPVAWLHVDCHLDNVLWRPDGRAVLLDFASAAIGPPELDLVRLLSEGFEESWRPALVTAYAEELGRLEAPADEAATLEERLRLAVPQLVQAAVAWAGAQREPTGRLALIRERWLASVCRLAASR